eukprot:366125-Chlamydomonas_euryale.AAC.3
MIGLADGLGWLNGWFFGLLFVGWMALWFISRLERGMLGCFIGAKAAGSTRRAQRSNCKVHRLLLHLKTSAQLMYSLRDGQSSLATGPTQLDCWIRPGVVARPSLAWLLNLS